MSDTSSPLWFRNHFVRDAIYKAIYDRMKVDNRVYVIGEGAGVKARYDAPYLEKEFANRVVTLPISEDSNTGMAVGMALSGLTVINDIITFDFAFRAMDSICNTAAKINFFHRNDPKTIVIKVETLLACATAGQRLEASFTRIHGLRVAVPSTPADAYGLMITSLTTPGVTIFEEDRMLKDSELIPLENSIDPIPFGKANKIHSGSNATVLSYALTLQRAKRVVEESNYNVDLIDLRTLCPLDTQMIFESLHKTRSLLIIEPDIQFMGIGAEIISEALETLDCPFRVKRLGSPKSTISASAKANEGFIPTEEAIKSAIVEAMN